MTRALRVGLGASLGAFAGCLGALAGPAAGAAPAVLTVLGPSVVDAPGGLALDAAGDLFVADTGHCRVLVVPARDEVLYGRHVRNGRASAVAGRSCTEAGAIGHPTAVAIDGRGDLFVAVATAQRVLEVPAGSDGRAVTVAGTGQAGFNGDGLPGTSSELDQPTSVAVDSAGNLFIADTANCRVRVLASADTTILGRPMAAGHLGTVAGTGVCGTTGQGGSAAAAQLWDPVAVAVDDAGDLLVADSGDQSVLLEAATAGRFYGTPVGAGDLGVVVGGTGSYGPYLGDGLSAVGAAAELDDPRGLTVAPSGSLFVTDGFRHAIRVIPGNAPPIDGRAMTAGDLYTAIGAVPVTDPSGAGDGTRWIGARTDTPVGVAVASSGAVIYSDAGWDTVRVLVNRAAARHPAGP